MALVKYNNNSLSSITDAASITKGAMTLIKSQTASSSATISFVDGTSDVVLDSTYPIYKFVWIDVHPATDNVRFSFQGNAAGGSGYNETITSTSFRSYHAEADNDTEVAYETGSDQAQGTAFQVLELSSVGNGNDEAVSGELLLFNPSSTTYVKHFISRSIENAANNYAVEGYVAGYFNTTSAIDEIQFKMSSGNIDSGTFKLYGIKDS